MNSDRVQAMADIRRALAGLDRLAIWEDGSPPLPDQVFTPPAHGRALDLERALVIGNRGVGKTFWASALVDDQARAVAADAYPRSGLNRIGQAAFGFRGGLSDERTADKDALREALGTGISAELLWLAVALRSIERLPISLVDLARQVGGNVESSQLRLRRAAEANAREGRCFLLVFDGLDRLGDTWGEIRPLTIGLLRFALAIRSLPGLAVKVFMRPDQFADPELWRFPDASKLVAERVDLRWHPDELYGLLFFHLRRNVEARRALESLVGEVSAGASEAAAFSALAGEWMGAGKKRGSTYTWIPMHLADAREEGSPRSFIKALARAAAHEPAPVGQAIDHKGIMQGVVAASGDRVRELEEDYWWMRKALQPLAGLLVPCERDDVFARWAGTCDAIQADATRGLSRLLPIFLESGDGRAEPALLEALRVIGVVEIRANGKINVPDIFRVGAGIMRKGGVKPPKARVT
ncbi:MAG: ATP-binding protein [Alphaproteobacteria bacterium]|nr:ATP-binding protein [Alphaproteobacteria bacterium]